MRYLPNRPKIDNSDYREEMSKFCSVKIDISCKTCEYAYFKATRLNPRNGCEIEDMNISVPETLIESRKCPYWERKGSRIIFKELKK